MTLCPGSAAEHPLLAAHAARRRPAVRLSELVAAGPLTRSELYDHLLHAAGVEDEIAIGMHTGRGEAIVLGLGRTEREFSERDRDVLDIACPVLESTLRTTQARGRRARRSSATATGGTSPSACFPAIRTRRCSRSGSPGSARTRSTASA